MSLSPSLTPVAASVLDYVPVVVNESQVFPFNFYKDHDVVEGMHYQNELYGLVCEVGSQKQLEAYNLACALSVQGGPVVVTVSKQRYAVWVSLRSPAYVAASSSSVDCPEVMAA